MITDAADDTDNVPKMSEDDVHVPSGLHYNVKYLWGVICSRVTPRYLQGEQPAEIEWVWICELKRYATATEIKALCRGK
jgi:hypothetical protein